MVKLTLLTLMIAWVAVGANGIRGSDDEALVNQSERELHYRRKYPRRRKSNPTLFLVEDDNRGRTRRCADYLEDEFEDCVDVEIVDDDDDADRGDYVFFLDYDTKCSDVKKDIRRELGCSSGYRRYRYGTGFRRYRFYKNRWWNRYHGDDDEKKGKSGKDDDGDDQPRRRWWHQRRPWWHRKEDDDDDDEEVPPGRRYRPRRHHRDDGDDKDDVKQNKKTGKYQRYHQQGTEQEEGEEEGKTNKVKGTESGRSKRNKKTGEKRMYECDKEDPDDCPDE